MSDFSFKKGFDQVKHKDIPVIREKIKEELGIKTHAAFLNRLNGVVVPLAPEYQAIERIFIEYGITENIWG